MSESRAAEDPAVINSLGQDVEALVQAWEDRGISPAEAGQALAACGNQIMLAAGATLGQVVAVLVEQWDKRGGRL